MAIPVLSDRELRGILTALGFVSERMARHGEMFLNPKDGNRFLLRTGGDPHGAKNSLADLRRMGYDTDNPRPKRDAGGERPAPPVAAVAAQAGRPQPRPPIPFGPFDVWIWFEADERLGYGARWMRGAFGPYPDLAIARVNCNASPRPAIVTEGEDIVHQNTQADALWGAIVK